MRKAVSSLSLRRLASDSSELEDSEVLGVPVARWDVDVGVVIIAVEISFQECVIAEIASFMVLLGLK
jgi:hypothetical protein